MALKTVTNNNVTVSSINSEKGIIYGVVYRPELVDSYNETFTAEEVEKMAHNFMSKSDLRFSIDISHNEIPIAAYPVESFIARAGDPEYQEGDWVLAVKVEDERVIEMFKQGELSGFSYQAMLFKEEVTKQVEVTRFEIFYTERTLDHTHIVVLLYDQNGEFIGGITNPVKGHYHTSINPSHVMIEGNHGHRINRNAI